MKAFNAEAEMLNDTMKNGGTYVITGAKVEPIRFEVCLTLSDLT